MGVIAIYVAFLCEVGRGLLRFKTRAWLNSFINTIVKITIVFFAFATVLQATEYGSLRISNTLSNPDQAEVAGNATEPVINTAVSASVIAPDDIEKSSANAVLSESVLLSGDAPIADAVVISPISAVEPVPVLEKEVTANSSAINIKQPPLPITPDDQVFVQQAPAPDLLVDPVPSEQASSVKIPAEQNNVVKPTLEKNLVNQKPSATEVDQQAVSGSNFEKKQNSDADFITPQTTLNQPSGKFKFNIVTDNMIDALNAIIPQNAALSGMSLETFHLMIAAAVARHPEMRAVVEQTKVAGFASGEAFSAYLPQISASMDAGTRTSRSSTSSDLLPKGEGVDAAMSVKQLLYDFGATGANYDSAKYKEQASLERLATKRSELSFRTISAYIELLRARLLYKLSQENYTSRLSILNMVKERYELGGGNKVDVIRAEARLTDASATRISAGISLQMAEAGYKEMFLEDPVETPLPQDVSIALASQSIDELSKKYGAVRETEMSLNSLRSDAKAAASRMLPTLNFEVNGARRSQETYYGEYSETSAHLVMRYNLFTGGADSARKEQAAHRAEQMQQDLDNLILQVKKSIVQSTTQVNEAEGLVRVRREGVLGASQSLLAVKEHFTYRRGTLLDLLRSQEELYIAGRDFISSIMDRSIARYRLLHLTAALETMIPDLKSQ